MTSSNNRSAPKLLGMMAATILLTSAAVGPALAQQRPQQGPTSALTAPTTPAGVEAAKPDPHAPGFRIPLPPLEQMDPAMRAEFESAALGMHTPVGNRFPLTLAPELNKGWLAMSAAVQTATIPQDVYELAIIMEGAYWRAGLEWLAHAPLAIKAGVPAEAVEAIRLGKTPKFANERQQAAYDVMHEFLETRQISDAHYERMRNILGSKGMVEMITAASWYGVVAMGMAAHGIPIRSDIPNPFPPKK